MKKHFNSNKRNWDHTLMYRGWIAQSSAWYTRNRNCIIERAKTNSPADWKKFKDLRKATKKRLALTRDKYFLNLLGSDDMDLKTRKPTVTKRFWTYMRSKRQDNVGVAPLEINDDVVSDSREKAKLLNDHFKSVFTKEDLQNMTPEATSPYADIPSIYFSTAWITKLLQKVDCKKAS